MEIVHSFNRGFGPHAFDFDVNNGLMFVLGEYECAFAVLRWDPVKLEFEEIHRTAIFEHQHVNDDWTGGDIAVNAANHVFVSLRHINGSGYIVKYEWKFFRGEWEPVAKTDVGEWPTRFTFSEDGARLLVANEMANSVSVLSAVDLSTIFTFKTGSLYPVFLHELHHRTKPNNTIVTDY